MRRLQNVETFEISKSCFENNIVLCRLFFHIFHKLQLCDVAVFASLKSVYREQIERLEREDVNTIEKEHFISLYSSAKETAFTFKNIKIDFAANELMSFNSVRVFKVISKSFAELIISTVDEIMIEHRSQDELLQTFVTSVSAETLSSLQNLIIKQNAHALDETSKQSLQRHV